MAMFERMIHEHPPMTYEDAEAVVWDNYPEDFRTYWGLDGHEAREHLDEDTWRTYRSMGQLVERLASGASQLIRPHGRAHRPSGVTIADRLCNLSIASHCSWRDVEQRSPNSNLKISSTHERLQGGTLGGFRRAGKDRGREPSSCSIVPIDSSQWPVFVDCRCA